MDSSFSPKDEIWFLRVCHHISIAVYLPSRGGVYGTVTQLSSSSSIYPGVWPIVYPFRLCFFIHYPWLCLPWRLVIYGGLSTGLLSPGHCSADKHLPVISSLVRKNKVDPVMNLAPSFSTSALKEGDWSPSHPGRFVLSTKLSSALWEDGWASPHTLPEPFGDMKNLLLLLEIVIRFLGSSSQGRI